MAKFNYYKDQLSKLEKSDYPMSIKIFDGNGGSTNQIDLNKESISALTDFLIDYSLKTKSKGSK